MNMNRWIWTNKIINNASFERTRYVDIEVSKGDTLYP